MNTDTTIHEEETNIFDVLIEIYEFKREVVRNGLHFQDEKAQERVRTIIDELNEDIESCLQIIRDA